MIVERFKLVTLYSWFNMKGRIRLIVLFRNFKTDKFVFCLTQLQMSDALAKVTEVLDFTEEKIVDILSDNHKVLGFFANNDLEEVKRKSEAIFFCNYYIKCISSRMGSFSIGTDWWVRRYQYLISDRAKNILYSAVLEPIPYLNVVAGRELNPNNPG